MTKYSTLDRINYVLERKTGQKTLRMHINPKGQLVVSCSPMVSKFQIESFIKSNTSWIEKHALMLQQYSYVDGETIPFWGKNYSLLLEEGRRKVQLQNNGILVKVIDKTDKERIKKALYEYYKKSLLEYIPERIEHWCRKLGIEQPDFSVNNSKSRWGVCYYKKRTIKISAMTACLPEELIDMTILHEICHLLYHNHASDFWDQMKTLMPDLDRRKKSLKEIDQNSSIHSLF